MIAIPEEEFTWAVECAAAGDTLEEIADWSGRSAAEWLAIFETKSLPPPTPRRATLDERMKRLAEEYEAGVPLMQMARNQGVSERYTAALVARLLDEGVVARRPRQMGRRVADPERNTLIEKLAGHLGCRKAAEALGIKVSTVTGVMRMRRQRLRRQEAARCPE